MQRLEVSGAVRPLYVSLGVKGLISSVSTGWRKKNACFSNNCNFVYFQYKKNYVNTKTTCNKCSFDYLH